MVVVVCPAVVVVVCPAVVVVCPAVVVVVWPAVEVVVCPAVDVVEWPAGAEVCGADAAGCGVDAGLAGADGLVAAMPGRIPHPNMSVRAIAAMPLLFTVEELRLIIGISPISPSTDPVLEPRCREACSVFVQ